MMEEEEGRRGGKKGSLTTLDWLNCYDKSTGWRGTTSIMNAFDFVSKF